MSAIFASDDIEAKRTSKLIDWSDGRASAVLGDPHRGLRRRGAQARVRRCRAMRDEGEITRQFMEARCDRGAEIARMLFLSEPTALAIRSLDEHWDGAGMPDGLRGEEIPLAARILCLSQTVEVFHRNRGVKAARGRRQSAPWHAGLTPHSSTRSWDSVRTMSSGRRSRPPTSRAWEPRELALAADEDSARSHRRGLRPRDRREVALYRPPLRARRRDRRRHRRGARLRRTGSCARSTALHCCTTSASSRSPTASSTSRASSPTRSSTRSRPTRSTRCGSSSAPRALPTSPSSPPTTTRSSTAAAIRARSRPTRSTCRCACWRSPTSTRR